MTIISISYPVLGILVVTLATLTSTQGQSDQTSLEEKNIENVSEPRDDGFYNSFRVEWRNNIPDPQYQNFDMNRNEFDKNFEKSFTEVDKTVTTMVWVGPVIGILMLVVCCLGCAGCFCIPACFFAKCLNKRKQPNRGHIHGPTSRINEQGNYAVAQGAYPTQPNMAPVSTYAPGHHYNISQHQPGGTTFIQPSPVPGTVTMISGNRTNDPPPAYNPHLGIVGQSSSTFTNPGYPPTQPYYPHQA